MLSMRLILMTLHLKKVHAGIKRMMNKENKLLLSLLVILKQILCCLCIKKIFLMIKLVIINLTNVLKYAKILFIVKHFG